MADILPHRLYYESKIKSVHWLNRKRIEHCLALAGDMTGKRILDAGAGGSRIGDLDDRDGRLGRDPGVLDGLHVHVVRKSDRRCAGAARDSHT